MTRWTVPEQIELYQKLERSLTGALGSHRATPEAPRVGPTPPSWWIDDEDATASTLAAMAQMGGTP